MQPADRGSAKNVGQGMKKEARKALWAFSVEIVIYSALVIVYFLLVLRFIAGGLQNLEQHHIVLYALVAIALIVGQAVLLEIITTALLRRLRGRSE
jgi:ABC-type enterochelin transport system permease subunit